jgi:uncharacterized membrane protein
MASVIVGCTDIQWFLRLIFLWSLIMKLLYLTMVKFSLPLIMNDSMKVYGGEGIAPYILNFVAG